MPDLVDELGGEDEITLNEMREVRQALTTAPTSIPKNLLEQFQFLATATGKYFYAYINKTWVKIASSVLSAKGDLLSSDGTDDTRLPVGPDGYILTADSSQTLGINWSPLILTTTLVAGENLSAHDALVIGDGSSYTLESTTNESQSFQSDGVSTTKVSQRFNTSLHAKYIAGGTFRYSTGTNDTVTCALYSSGAGSGGAPATLMGSVTVNPTDTTGTHATVSFTFSSPIAVIGSTDYHFVFTTTGNGAFFYTGGTAGTGTYFTNAALSSVFTVRNGPMYHSVIEINTVAGLAYKASTAFNNVLANNFIGYAMATASISTNVPVQVDGVHTTSGLTIGILFLQDTPGAVGNTPATNTRKVGLALSSTLSLIKHDNS
jgi:hypothetical protein